MWECETLHYSINYCKLLTWLWPNMLTYGKLVSSAPVSFETGHNCQGKQEVDYIRTANIVVEPIICLPQVLMHRDGYVVPGRRPLLDSNMI